MTLGMISVGAGLLVTGLSYLGVLVLWQAGFNTSWACLNVPGLRCMGVGTVVGGASIFVGTAVVIWAWVTAERERLPVRLVGFLIATWASSSIGILIGLAAYDESAWLSAFDPQLVALELGFAVFIFIGLILLSEARRIQVIETSNELEAEA